MKIVGQVEYFKGCLAILLTLGSWNFVIPRRMKLLWLVELLERWGWLGSGRIL